MEQKVCLDTGVGIEIIKDTATGVRILGLIEEHEIFISSISVFELYLREFNIDKIDFFLEKINVLDFNHLTAIKASDISKYLKDKGLVLEFRDIFIAASCIVNNCSLLTLNKKHFERINGLRLLGLK